MPADIFQCDNPDCGRIITSPEESVYRVQEVLREYDGKGRLVKATRPGQRDSKGRIFKGIGEDGFVTYCEPCYQKVEECRRAKIS